MHSYKIDEKSEIWQKTILLFKSQHYQGIKGNE